MQREGFLFGVFFFGVSFPQVTPSFFFPPAAIRPAVHSAGREVLPPRAGGARQVGRSVSGLHGRRVATRFAGSPLRPRPRRALLSFAGPLSLLGSARAL